MEALASLSVLPPQSMGLGKSLIKSKQMREILHQVNIVKNVFQLRNPHL